MPQTCGWRRNRISRAEKPRAGKCCGRRESDRAELWQISGYPADERTTERAEWQADRKKWGAEVEFRGLPEAGLAALQTVRVLSIICSAGGGRPCFGLSET